jgi:hypothetical protein
MVKRSFAERANLLATPSGFWKRELLGAKPIAMCTLHDPFAHGPRSLTSDEQHRNQRPKNSNGRSGLSQPEISRGDVLSFYA